MKKLAAIVLGLIILLAAVVLVGPSFVDWNSYKPQISAAVEEQTGRRLIIDGPIDLQVLPSPRLSVADVRLSNSPGASEPDMARLESLQVHVALQPLLTGTVRIASVTLIRPVISLERLADGSVNWDFAKTGAGAGSRAATDGGNDGAVAAVSLDGAEVLDGVVIFQDATSGQTHRLDDIDAMISASSLTGPFSVEGVAAYQGLKAKLQAGLGKIDAGRAAAATIMLEIPQAGGSIAYEGTIDLDGGPTVRGDLAVKAEDLAGFANAISGVLKVEADVPAPLARMFDMTAKVVATPDTAEVKDLVIVLGEARAQGSVTAALGEVTEIDTKLSVSRLDLDKMGFFQPPEPGSTPVSAAAPGADAGGEAGFTLPTGIRASAVLSADALDVKGRTIRQIRLDSTLDNGVVAVDVLTAQLPGGTDLTVTGTLYADAGLPRFIGRTDVVSDNLRTALDWLGAPLEGMAQDRLRKGVFGADVDASPQQVQLTNWTVDIDNTSIGGGLSLLLRERPAFGLSLSVDRINLDAYLPAAATPAAGATASTAGGPADTTKAGAEVTTLLSSFDANFLVQIGEATYQNTVFRESALDATVQDGKVVIRDLSVKDVGGASVVASGTLAGTVAQPSTDIEVTVEAKSAARLARLAGLEVNGTVKKLGGFSLRSKILGSLESLSVDAGLKMVGGAVSLKGVVEPLVMPPKLDLALKVSHPKSENLIGLLADGFDKHSLKLGPGTLTGTVVSRPDQNMDIETTLDLAASRLKVAGKVNPFAAHPSIDGMVSFTHPDVVRLIRLAAPTFKPSKRDLGPLAVSFAVKGAADAVDLGALSITAGPAALTGTGKVDLGEARPSLAFTLAADTVEIDPWLPPKAPKPSGAVPAVPAKADGREWSRDRIDFSLLQAVDAQLELTVGRVIYSPYIVDSAALSADLEAGKLTVRQLAGGLFGGRIEAAGRLVSTDTPSMEMALKIDKADVRQAALATSNIGQVSGVLDYDASLSARGRSEFDLVSALQGDGRFSIRDGAVEGIDLPAVSDQLKELDRAVDFLVLAQRAMSGGNTPFDSLTGSYVITDGVLRSDDVTLRSSSASGKTTAVINLPPQEMDAQSRFWLTEHVNSPPIGVRHVGPLSNPRMVLDVEKMQAYVLQRVVQRGILRQFNNKQPSAAPTTPVQQDNTTQQPAPVKPRDALQGILKGLLK